MGAIGLVLLVAFIIVCVLSILLVLVQDQNNSGMGGMFGGGNSAAFGSHSATVLTKATGVFVALFFVFALSLAFVNKKSSKSDDLNKAAAESGLLSNEGESKAADWWEKEVKATTETTVTAVEETTSTPVAETETAEADADAVSIEHGDATAN